MPNADCYTLVEKTLSITHASPATPHRAKLHYATSLQVALAVLCIKKHMCARIPSQTTVQGQIKTKKEKYLEDFSV